MFVFNVRLPGETEQKYQSPNVRHKKLYIDINFKYWLASKKELIYMSRCSAQTCGLKHTMRSPYISWTFINKEVVTYHWLFGAQCFMTIMLSWNIRHQSSSQWHDDPSQKNGGCSESLKTHKYKKFKLNISVNISTDWKCFQAINEQK